MTPPPEDNNTDDLLGGVDPLKWLESLAARQGANPEEFLTSADLEVPEIDPDSVEIDEPGYVPYDPLGPGRRQVVEPVEPEPEPALEAPTPAEPVMPPPVGDPLSGDVDPLAWLESLARRQGAAPEEFVTAADMDIPEIDPDSVVIDEPGYTPYQVTAAPVAPAPVEPEPILFEPEAPPEEVAPAEEAPAAPVAAGPIDPLSGDVDPIAWLESLARRQGAAPEEFMTAADMDIPEPVDAVIDEPGYVPYSPFASDRLTVPPEAEAEVAAPPELARTPEPEEEIALSAGDTLAWLQGLAEEQGAVPPSIIEAAQPVEAADPLAGLSDEEIEEMSARGELTPEQMRAWLARQAERLEETRAAWEMAAVAEEDLAPAEPVEQLPDWLEGAMPVEGVAEPEPMPLVEEIAAPPEPEDLPDWLTAEVSTDLDSELMELFEAPAAAVVEGEPEASPVAEPARAGEFEDSWADALHEEFTQQMEAVEEEPEWYTTRLQDRERLAAVEAALAEHEARQAAEVEEEEEEALEPALPGEVPDWLSDMAPPEVPDEAVIGVAAEEVELPDWLTEPVEITGDAIAEWLSTQELDEAAVEAEPVPADMPAWLTEAIPEVPEEAVVEAPEPEPVLEPAAPLPAPLPAPGAIVEPAAELTPADTAALLGVDVGELTPAPVEPVAAPAAPIVEAEAAPPPEPARVPVAAAPAPSAPLPPVPPPTPVSVPVAITVGLPAGEAYAAFRAKLEATPGDHATRLDLARALHQNDDLAASLGQYQALIQSEAKLEDVSADLGALVEANPSTPQVYRLLGDSLVRLGRLQDALDTYRAALEQL